MPEEAWNGGCFNCNQNTTLAGLPATDKLNVFKVDFLLHGGFFSRVQRHDIMTIHERNATFGQPQCDWIRLKKKIQ